LNNNLFDNKAMQSSVLRVSIDSAGFTTSDSSSRRLTDSSKPTSIKVVLQNNSPLEVHSATATKSFELYCSRGRQSSLTETCLYPQVCAFLRAYVRVYKYTYIFVGYMCSVVPQCNITFLRTSSLYNIVDSFISFI